MNKINFLELCMSPDLGGLERHYEERAFPYALAEKNNNLFLKER